MFISIDFVPTNFDILEFYGEDKCFAWNKKNLVMFSYSKDAKDATVSKIAVPHNVKSLRCFDSRVFILCDPQGIFKLLRNHELASLSSIGIANGPSFYQVFVSQNNWLHSQNKSKKSDTRLCQLEKCLDGHYRIHDITLDKRNSESNLRKAIISQGETDSEICIFANNKRVFAMTDNGLQLIYSSDYEVTDISTIRKKQSIAGIIFVTTSALVLTYVVDEKLTFDKVYVRGDVCSLSAGIRPNSQDCIWLANLNETGISYWIRSIKEDTFEMVKTDSRRQLAIRNFSSESLIVLSENVELSEIEIESLDLQKSENEFFYLKPEMLKGTEGIVNVIFEKAKELQSLNEKLLKQQEKLKRISIYSHKQRIIYLPEIQIERIAGQVFTRIKFANVLPLNCSIVISFKSKQQITQCVRYIDDSVVSIDLFLKDGCFDDNTCILVDLVTHTEDSKAWCLIKNYLKNPKVESLDISHERRKFLNAKLIALRNLARQSEWSMKELSALKKSIRKELNS